MDQMRDNKNSFYDVFEKYSQKDIIDYKRRIGMPVVTIGIEEAKKSLNK